MNTKTSLHANHLSCIRQNKPLFSNLSFELNAGEALLIKGPNGSGKSSLLRILAGLATPTHGEHLWCGEKIEDQRLHYFNHLHYISQNNGLKLELSIIENLQLAAHLALVQIPDLQTLLSQFQLLADQQTSVKYLSAGQKRRVALAKLFLIPKLLWILDEPLTALDGS